MASRNISATYYTTTEMCRAGVVPGYRLTMATMPDTGSMWDSRRKHLGKNPLEVCFIHQKGKIISRGFSSHWQFDIENFSGQEYTQYYSMYTYECYIFYFLMELMQNRTQNSCVYRPQAQTAGTAMWEAMGCMFYNYQLPKKMSINYPWGKSELANFLFCLFNILQNNYHIKRWSKSLLPKM